MPAPFFAGSLCFSAWSNNDLTLPPSFLVLQYNSKVLEEPDMDVCDVYGAEHLLRLFGMTKSLKTLLPQRHVSQPAPTLHLTSSPLAVKLPALLAHTDLNAKATAALTACLHDLMRHMQKNLAKVATGTYEDTTATYRKMASKS